VPGLGETVLQFAIIRLPGSRAEAVGLVDRALLDPAHSGPEIQKDLLQARLLLTKP
jgi:hypothetical protein